MNNLIGKRVRMTGKTLTNNKGTVITFDKYFGTYAVQPDRTSWAYNFQADELEVIDEPLPWQFQGLLSTNDEPQGEQNGQEI